MSHATRHNFFNNLSYETFNISHSTVVVHVAGTGGGATVAAANATTAGHITDTSVRSLTGALH